MILSMTGFGAGVARGTRGTASVEIKSLNYRFCDVSLRLPRELAPLELPLREVIQRRLIRGKVEVSIRWEADGGAATPRLSRQTLVDFHRQWQQLCADVPGLPPLDARSLLLLPGVVQSGPEESPEDAEGAIREAVAAALQQLDDARAAEGGRLLDDVLGRLGQVEAMIQLLEARRSDIFERYRQRLRERWDEICEGTGIMLDKGRLEAEGMVLADKADVTEELVRLQAHIKAFRAQVAKDHPEPAGKPLDFLLQEFFREMNTIGSKARDVEVTAQVLRAKHELEKMREQVQNLV